MPASAPALLTASGMAEAEIYQDYGVLHFALEETAETVIEAQDKMDATLVALRTALNAQGISDAEIRGANYEVHAVYEYNYTKYSDQRTLTGYNVLTAVEVHVQNTDNAVAIIAAVDSAGVNCSYDLVFETRDDPAAYDVALEKAAQEALRKAQVLANAAGLSLGELVSLEETEEESMAVVKVTYTVK